MSENNLEWEDKCINLALKKCPEIQEIEGEQLKSVLKGKLDTKNLSKGEINKIAVDILSSLTGEIDENK